MNTARSQPAPSSSIIYVVERQQQLLQDDKSCSKGRACIKSLARTHTYTQSHTHMHTRSMNS